MASSLNAATTADALVVLFTMVTEFPFARAMRAATSPRLAWRNSTSWSCPSGDGYERAAPRLPAAPARDGVLKLLFVGLPIQSDHPSILLQGARILVFPACPIGFRLALTVLVHVDLAPPEADVKRGK